MGAATSTDVTDYSQSFDCHVCLQPVHIKKDGPGCQGCPAFAGTHYFPRGEGWDAPDVLVVGDVPEAPALALLKRNENNRNFYHEAFTDDGGKVVRAAVAQLQAYVPSAEPGKTVPSLYSGIRVRYVYAVKCAVEKPNKDVIEHCSTPLANELSKIDAARRAAGKTNRLVVLANGVVALRALGIVVPSFEDHAAGRVFEVEYGQIQLVVVAMMSLKALAAVGAGKYSSIVADVKRAFDVVRGQSIRQAARAEVEKNYRYPRTIAEVRELVDEILSYTEGETHPDQWAIAFDTETNTLHPHRDGTKMLTATFAWAEGRACSIPLWHPGLHTPKTVEDVGPDGEKVSRVVAPAPVDDSYTPEAAWEHVKRLLASPKPKIGHNLAKYDQKVVWKYGFDINNLRWDCMLAEHALEEDKKGQYGLKYLVKQYIPELSGYEDKLHEYLDKEEGADQGASIRAKQADAEKDRPLPKPIADALERTGLTPKFQVGTLEKQLDRARSRLVSREVIAEAVAFLERYEIKPPFKGRAFTKAWRAIQNKAKEIKEQGTLAIAAEFAAAEIAVIETMSKSDDDMTVFEPVTEADEQFVRDAELLIAAKRNGEFQKKAEKKAGKNESDGGFEKIPLDELNFYGAVDADATRRLAVIQRRRMSQEDWTLAQRRRRVEIDLKHSRGTDRLYRVEVLCTEPDGSPKKDPLVSLHRERYLPRARALAAMEYSGVRIDENYLRESKIELDNVVSRTETSIYEMAGDRFKIGSTAQLGQHLFTSGVGFIHPDPEAAAELANHPDYADKVKWDGRRMSYEWLSKTLKGAIQVNEKTFKHYITNYKCPFSDLILLYKKAIKARDTFLASIELLSSLDKRIHTNFNLNGTSTGRLSSNNVNLQNLPRGVLGAILDKKGKLVLGPDGRPIGPGVKCKKLFIPDDDSYCIVNADAKGAEVNVFAGYARDADLIQALREGMDAHCFFSAETLNPDKIGEGLTGEARRAALAAAGIDDEHGWTFDDFNNREAFSKSDDPALAAYGKRLDAHRTNIKRVVFGILFGAGARKIAEIAGIPERLAQTIIKGLFARFRSIPNFVEFTKWELRTFGCVETYHGRRRRFSMDPKTAPRKLLAKAERQAVNFKIQGTNSDIVLDVLCDVAKVLERDLRGRMLMTVHDSLVFQVPKRYANQVKDLMYTLGTARVKKTCPWLPVDYKWDVEIGTSYGSLQKADDYVKSLPESLFVPPLQGYTEEEMFEDLRNQVWEREEAEAS